MLNALLDGITGVLGVIIIMMVAVSTEHMYIITSITHDVLPDAAAVVAVVVTVVAAEEKGVVVVVAAVAEVDK